VGCPGPARARHWGPDRLGVRMKPTRTDQRRARRALLRQTATVGLALFLTKLMR